MSNPNNFNMASFTAALLDSSSLHLKFDDYVESNRPSPGSVNITAQHPAQLTVPAFHYSAISLQSTASTASSPAQPVPDLDKLVQIIRAVLVGLNAPPPPSDSQYLSEEAFRRKYPRYARLLKWVKLLASTRSSYTTRLSWIKDSSPMHILEEMSAIIYEAIQLVSGFEIACGRTEHLQEPSKLSRFVMLACVANVNLNIF